MFLEEGGVSGFGPHLANSIDHRFAHTDGQRPIFGAGDPESVDAQRLVVGPELAGGDGVVFGQLHAELDHRPGLLGVGALKRTEVAHDLSLTLSVKIAATATITILDENLQYYIILLYLCKYFMYAVQ